MTDRAIYLLEYGSYELDSVEVLVGPPGWTTERLKALFASHVVDAANELIAANEYVDNYALVTRILSRVAADGFERVEAVRVHVPSVHFALDIFIEELRKSGIFGALAHEPMLSRLVARHKAITECEDDHG
jgi:hypothetical protein